MYREDIADVMVIEEYAQFLAVHPFPHILDPTEPIPPFEDERAP